MAKRETTKVAASSSTALTPTNVTALHTPAYEEAEAAAERISVQAFADGVESDKRKNTATQRMAAAIFYHHSALVSSGTKIASLTEYVSVRADDKSREAQLSRAAVRDITKHMRTKFVGKSPDRPLAKNEDAEYASAVKEHERKGRVLGLGLTLAGILARLSVPLANFVEAKGVWKIHAQMLCPVGFQPLPGVDTVLLDGSGFIAGGKKPGAKNPSFHKAQASVSALQTAIRPPLERKPRQGGDTNISIVEHTTTLRNEINRMAKELKRFPNKNDFHTADWTALNGLRKLIMQIEIEPIVIDAEPVAKTA